MMRARGIEKYCERVRVASAAKDRNLKLLTPKYDTDNMNIP
jgi:hypothetical protein